MLLGTGLMAMAGVVLVAAFAAARTVVALGAKTLRIDDRHLGVYGPRAQKLHAESSLKEADIKRFNYVIRAQAGTFVSPVVSIGVPGYDTLTMTVDDPEVQWSCRDVEESEEEAMYTLSSADWKDLVDALDIEN